MKYRILCLLSYGAFRLEIPALVLKSEYLLQPLERTESFALRIQDGVKAQVSDDTCSRNLFTFFLIWHIEAFSQVLLGELRCYCCCSFVVFIYLYLKLNRVLEISQNSPCYLWILFLFVIRGFEFFTHTPWS